MVNTFGLRKQDVLYALSENAGVKFMPALNTKTGDPIPGFYWNVVNSAYVLLDLRADDGFDEYTYDRALGRGSAQRAVNWMRAQKGYKL